jgi:hypothetical protein
VPGTLSSSRPSIVLVAAAPDRHEVLSPKVKADGMRSAMPGAGSDSRFPGGELQQFFRSFRGSIILSSRPRLPIPSKLNVKYDALQKP